ncbi:MAG TPA: hypothetical protein VEW72_14180 [Burkholderiales bacterium]|nr:hypothetical protein [Burkholderiales bacterium]
MSRALIKKPRPAPRFAHRQKGVFALAVVAMLGVLLTLLIIGYAQDQIGQRTFSPQTSASLAQAKEALIAYAATYRDSHPNETFGYLPCPDDGTSANEGEADNACDSADVTVIGRLPWKTLGLQPLRDNDGECLWYAVSGNFKNNPKSTQQLMNWDTNGLIEIMAADASTFVAGSTPQNRAVAVIFSPGPALATQDRSLGGANPPTVCGGNYTVSNYLDRDVASGIDNRTATSSTANQLSRFIAAVNSDTTAATNDAFNDQVVAIAPADIFLNGVQKRTDLDPALAGSASGMLRQVAECLVRFNKTTEFSINNSYADRRLPWAAPLAAVSSSYGVATNYNDGSAVSKQYAGRLPFTVNNSASAGEAGNKVFAVPTYGTGNDTLLSSITCGSAIWSDPTNGLWRNWKDHIYYAVAPAFSAYDNVYWSSPNPCSIGGTCYTVDGVSDIAAVVIFAGPRQGVQSRNNNAIPSYASSDRDSASNFLEGANLSAIQTNPTSPIARTFSKTAGNDTVMCIRVNGSGLYVDPTCGKSSTCTADGNSLAGYRSGSTNNCKSGNSVLSACQNLTDRLNQNNCSCEAAAKTFISKDCLNGISSTQCISAHTSVDNCS